VAADQSNIPSWHPQHHDGTADTADSTPQFMVFRPDIEYSKAPDPLHGRSDVRGPDPILRPGLNAIIPDASEYLPQEFDPAYKNPCWRLEEEGELYCMPYFYILGAMQCGARELYLKLQHHPDVKHIGESYYFDAKKTTKKWLEEYKGHASDLAIQTEAVQQRQIIGDGSQGTFTFTMAHAEALHPTYHDTRRACHRECDRLSGDERKSCQAGPDNSNNCYLQAQRAEVAHWKATGGEMTVPLLVRSVMGTVVPKFIIILKNPTERYYETFRNYEHYPKYYGANMDGFVRFIKEQIEAFRGCEAAGISSSACVMYFEAMAPELEAVFYHADQLFKGMYSVFMEYWLGAFPKESFLVLQHEEYKRDPLHCLNRVFTHLGLHEPSEEVVEKMRQQTEEVFRGSEFMMEARKNLPEAMSTEARRLLDDFYRPYNEKLAKLLDDDRFLWD